MLYCLGNQCDMPNKIAFCGLIIGRSSLKVCSSSNGHQPDVSSHLPGSLGSSYHPDNGSLLGNGPRHTVSFSISHANGGEQ